MPALLIADGSHGLDNGGDSGNQDQAIIFGIVGVCRIAEDSAAAMYPSCMGS